MARCRSKLPLALGVETRNGRHLFVASKQDTHRWLAPNLLNFDPIVFSLSAYLSAGSPRCNRDCIKLTG